METSEATGAKDFGSQAMASPSVKHQQILGHDISLR